MRFLLCFFVIITTLTHAAIPREGWYLGYNFGPSYMDKISFSTFDPFLYKTVYGSVNYKIGFDGGAQIGYRYDKWRFEGSVFFSKNNFKQLSLIDELFITFRDLFNFHGSTTASIAFINIFYDFFCSDQEIRFVPYFGAGGGYGYFKNNINLSFDQFSLPAKNLHAAAPLLQAIIGLNYFFNDLYSLGLDFRYLSTPTHPNFHSRGVINSLNIVFNATF